MSTKRRRRRRVDRRKKTRVRQRRVSRRVRQKRVGGMSTVVEAECPICFEIKQLCVLDKCKHQVCQDCYRRMTNRPAATCPLCRSEITTVTCNDVMLTDTVYGYYTSDDMRKSAANFLESERTRAYLAKLPLDEIEDSIVDHIVMELSLTRLKPTQSDYEQIKRDIREMAAQLK